MRNVTRDKSHSSKAFKLRLITWLGQFLFFVSVLFFAEPLYAACTTPTGNAGTIENFPVSNVSKYCNGSSWVSMQYGGLTQVGSLTDSGNIQYPGAVTAIGNYGYVLDSANLNVFDLSNAKAPVKLTTFTLPISGQAITAAGNYLYISGSNTLVIVNVSTPATPSISGQVTNSTYIPSAADIKIVGNYAYIIGSSTLGVVNISNPAAPAVTGYLTDSTNMSGLRKIAISGNYAYVTVSASKITAINISNPASPTFVSSLNDSTSLYDSRGITISSNYVYVAYHSNSSSDGGVTIIDVSNPASMSKISVVSSVLQAYLIEKVGNYLYVSQSLNGCSIYTYDISVPTLPVLMRIDNGVACYGLNAMAAGTSTTRMLGTADGVIYTIDISPQSLLPMYSSNTLSDGDVTSYQDISISGNIAVAISSNHDLTTIDISNPNSMVNLGRLSARESYNRYSKAVVNIGSYAYMSMTNFSAIRIVDISTPSNPQFVSDFSNVWLSGVEKMVRSGNYLYTIGSNGLAILDISSPTAPVFKGSINAGMSFAKGIAISGNYAYVSSGGNNTLFVVDISNPTSPTIVGSIVDSTYLLNARDVAVSGNYVFVVANNYLTAINISTPSAPTVASNLYSTNFGSYSGTRLKILGNLLFLNAGYNNSAAIIDISTPTSLTAVKYLTNSNNNSIDVSGSYWYFASQMVQSYDITTPATPVLKSSINWIGKLQGIGGVASSGNYILLTASGSNAARVYDISNIFAPTLVASVVDATRLAAAGRFAFDGTYMYILANNHLTIVNASTPTSPALQGYLQDNTNFSSPVSVAVSGNYAYVAASGRLAVVNISNKSSPTLVTSLVNASLSQCKGIFVSGNYAYLACDNFFAIIDVSVPSSPTLVGSLTDSNYYYGGNGIAVYGNYAYFSADSTYGGAIIDISVKTNPTMVKGYNPYTSSAQSRGLYLNGSTLYWSDAINRNLQQLDLSTDPTEFNKISVSFSSSPGGYPTSMTLAGNKFVGVAYSSIELWDISPKSVATTQSKANLQNKYASVKASAVSGNKLYALNYGGTLSVIDVSSPASPTLVSSFFNTRLSNPMSLVIDGNYAYYTAEGGCSYCLGIVDISDVNNIKMVSTFGDYTNAYYASGSKVIGTNWYVASPAQGRVAIFNIANKKSISLLGNYSTTGVVPYGLDVVGNYAYICGSGKLQVLNVSTPASISLAGELSDSGLTNCRKITVTGNYALASSTSGDFVVIDISNPASPTKTSAINNSLIGYANTGVKVDGNIAFVGKSDGISVIDNTSVASPTYTDGITGSSYSTIANSGNNIFLMDGLLSVYTYTPFTNLGACSTAGALSYNSTQNVYSYCDGSLERPLGAYPGSGGAGCSSPSGLGGALKYDTSSSKYRYCDGTNWVPIIGRIASLPNCSNTATGAESTGLANGQTYSCTCTASAISSGTVYGTSMYSYSSKICRAAAHAGKVSSGGGEVKYRMQAGQSSYTGSTQNSVTTSSMGSDARSFDFP